jgi:MFS family permease
VTQALVTSYLVAAVVLQSPAGKIGDRVGHARLIVIGQLVVAAGALMGFLAPSLGWLVVARILMAVGGAALVPSTLALMRHALPVDRRGRAFGAFGASMALSAAIGPLVGGELVDAFGWPSVFAANIPVLAVAAVLILTSGRALRPTHTTPARFDWVGSTLLAAGLTAIILGMRPDGLTTSLVVVGVALLIPFGLWERRVSDPVIAFSLFRSVHFSAGSSLIALQNLVMYAMLFEVPLVAAALFDLHARGTGRLLLSMMLAMVVTSLVAGRLTDRYGARLLALAGSTSALLGIAVMVWIDLTAAGQLVLPLVLMGIGIGLTSPAAQSASMSAIEPELAGMAAGIGSTMRYLGGIIGVAVLSLLLDVHGTRADVVSEHRVLTVVFAGALVVGTACAALLPGRPTGSSPPAPRPVR